VLAAGEASEAACRLRG